MKLANRWLLADLSNGNPSCARSLYTGMNPQILIPRNERILNMFVMLNPTTKASNANLISFAVFMNVLADRDTSRMHTKATIPVPNFPSIPQILLLRSLEKRVENMRERNTSMIPPSKVPLSMVSLPSHTSFTISKVMIIVPRNSTSKPIPLSVQSHGKGMIDSGARKRIR